MLSSKQRWTPGAETWQVVETQRLECSAWKSLVTPANKYRSLIEHSLVKNHEEVKAELHLRAEVQLRRFESRVALSPHFLLSILSMWLPWQQPLFLGSI